MPGPFDGWNWNLISAGINVLSSIFSASNASNANQTAANMARSNQATNLATIQAGKDQALGYLAPVAEQGKAMAQPGINYLKTVTAQNPYTLNPQQTREVADRTLTATRGVPLSLRGSGRTSTAIINDTTNRAREAMAAQNIARSDTAANTLATQGLAGERLAAPAMANVATGFATGATNIGDTATKNAANAVTSTAASDNSALNAIASYFAGMAKDETRPGRYSDYKAANA